MTINIEESTETVPKVIQVILINIENDYHIGYEICRTLNSEAMAQIITFKSVTQDQQFMIIKSVAHDGDIVVINHFPFGDNLAAQVMSQLDLDFVVVWRQKLYWVKKI